MRALEAELRTAELVTTDEVLVELLAYFSRSGSNLRTRMSAFVRALYDNPAVRVIPQSHESFLAGLALYEQRPDKGYSLVDCVSMHTMRHLGVSRALTGDRHFEQEGFEVLFAP